MYLQAGMFRWGKKKPTNFSFNFRFLGLQTFFVFGGLVFFFLSFLVLKRADSARRKRLELMNSSATNEKQNMKDTKPYKLTICWEDKKPTRGKMQSIEGGIFFFFFLCGIRINSTLGGGTKRTDLNSSHLWIIITRILHSFPSNAHRRYCADEVFARMNTLNTLTHCEATVSFSSSEPLVKLSYNDSLSGWSVLH